MKFLIVFAVMFSIPNLFALSPDSLLIGDIESVGEDNLNAELTVACGGTEGIDTGREKNFSFELNSVDWFFLGENADFQVIVADCALENVNCHPESKDLIVKLVKLRNPGESGGKVIARATGSRDGVVTILSDKYGIYIQCFGL